MNYPAFINRFKSVKIFVPLILFITTFLLMFLFAEVIVSLIKSPLQKIESVSDYYQFNINYGLEPKPNDEYVEYGLNVKVNSKGMYGPEIDNEKKGLRIAYLGDSYSAGPGIEFQKNYPYQVTEKLKSNYQAADFLIGGLGGSSPFQQKFIYQSKVLPYKPDIVVYELFDNDINDDYVYRYSQYYARVQVYNAVPTFLRESKFVQQVMLLVMDQLYSYYKYKYQATKDIINANPTGIWEKYTKPSLDEMLLLSKKNNIKFVLIYIPSGWSFDNEYTKDPAKEKKYVLGELAQKWAQKNDVPFVDMYDELLKHNTPELNELYLTGDKGYHLTELGASLVTDQTYKLILDSLNKKN